MHERASPAAEASDDPGGYLRPAVVPPPPSPALVLKHAFPAFPPNSYIARMRAQGRASRAAEPWEMIRLELVELGGASRNDSSCKHAAAPKDTAAALAVFGCGHDIEDAIALARQTHNSTRRRPIRRRGRRADRPAFDSPRVCAGARGGKDLGPRFPTARGLLAEIGSDLLIAKPRTLATVGAQAADGRQLAVVLWQELGCSAATGHDRPGACRVRNSTAISKRHRMRSRPDLRIARPGPSSIASALAPARAALAQCHGRSSGCLHSPS